MARNPVAANLLLLVVLVGGLMSAARIPQETLPETSLDRIQVLVEYPGASPEEIEEGIVTKVEDSLEGIEGIIRIDGLATENIGSVIAELERGADMARVLDEVKAEVDGIRSFPDEAERPQVRELTLRRRVVQLAIHGDVPERTLRDVAFQVKEEIAALPGISFVATSATRDYEIGIEVSQEALLAHGLTLQEVAAAVQRGSMDLPGGTIQSEGTQLLVRTTGQRYTGDAFGALVIRAGSDGSILRLRDLATIEDGFEESDLQTRFDGAPTAMVEVYRMGDERVLDIADAVSAYVADLSLPPGVSVDLWQDEAEILRSRYQLMVKNGLTGLLLVIICLGLFLNVRLAFWVSVGIVFSFLGAFLVMVYLGATINLITLVGFILALGIVVDDAIVVGEGVFAGQEDGLLPADAAVVGTQRLAQPVVFAVLTTMAAFVPLLNVPGVIGKFMGQLPIVIIAVLLLSLVESLFVLPAHLAHVRARRDTAARSNPLLTAIERAQEGVSRLVTWTVDGPLERTARFCARHYGVVLATGIAGILLSVGLVRGGFVGFTFAPDVEGENIVVQLEMPQGTPAHRTAEMAEAIEAAGVAAVASLQATLDETHPPLLQHVYSVVGIQPSSQGILGDDSQTRSHLAEVNMELLESEVRDLPTSAVEEAWRERLSDLAGARSIDFISGLFSAGEDLQLEISGPAGQMDAAVDYARRAIADYAGVSDIRDDRELGRQEAQLFLKPAAQTLGVTLDALAGQVRAGFHGEEALRVQRGRDEVAVVVRLPREQRDALSDLERLRIRTPSGVQVPLVEVAEVSLGTGPSSISRTDRRRVTTITADVDEAVADADDVIASLERTMLPELARLYPGAVASFEGENREQSEALDNLLAGFLIALLLIYALLAIPFKSYTQPFIIMAAIPFGLIGAVFGHLVMGLDIGMMSLFGMVGLSGVVVNDSLVLIHTINAKRAEGASLEEAIVAGSKLRFRPILLTSLTTFFGVLPLILEQSLQAQFLIPIAASLGFGVLFVTFVVLVLVPALVVLEERLRHLVSIRGHRTLETVDATTAPPRVVAAR